MLLLKLSKAGDFLDGSAIKTLPSNARVEVRSLVRELRYHKPRGQKKKKKTTMKQKQIKWSTSKKIFQKN